MLDKVSGKSTSGENKSAFTAFGSANGNPGNLMDGSRQAAVAAAAAAWYPGLHHPPPSG